MPFPVDMKMVRQTEEKLGRRLPLGYLVRMCRENGGTVAADWGVWFLHPIFDDTDRTRLKRTCNDIVRETAVARRSTAFPGEAVAIGSNGCGDILVFLPDAEGNRFGDAVHWWDHETGDVHKVADDFSELSDA